MDHIKDVIQFLVGREVGAGGGANTPLTSTIELVVRLLEAFAPPEGSFVRSFPVLCSGVGTVLTVSGFSMLRRLGIPVLLVVQTTAKPLAACSALASGGLLMQHSLSYTWQISLLRSLAELVAGTGLFAGGVILSQPLGGLLRMSPSKVTGATLCANGCFATAAFVDVALRMRTAGRSSTGIALASLAAYVIGLQTAVGIEMVAEVHVLRPMVYRAIQCISRLGGLAARGISRTVCMLMDITMKSLRFVWQKLVKPVGSALISILGSLWRTVVKPVLMFLKNAVVKIFTCLYKVLDYTLRTASSLANILWRSILKPVLTIIADIASEGYAAMRDGLIYTFRVIARVSSYLWSSIIRPTLTTVANVVGRVWSWLSRRCTQICNVAWTAILRPLFRAVTNVAVEGTRLLWQGLRNALAATQRFGREFMRMTTYLSAKLFRLASRVVRLLKRWVVIPVTKFLSKALRFGLVVAWPTLMSAISTKFIYSAYSAEGFASRLCFSLAAVSSISASLCLIGRAVVHCCRSLPAINVLFPLRHQYLLEDAFSSWGRRLSSLGTWVILRQDAFVLDLLFYATYISISTCRDITAALASLLRKAFDHLHNILANTARGIYRLSTYIFSVFWGAMRRVANVVFRALLFIWEEPVLSSTCSCIALASVYLLWSGRLQLPPLVTSSVLKLYGSITSDIPKYAWRSADDLFMLLRRFFSSDLPAMLSTSAAAATASLRAPWIRCKDLSKRFYNLDAMSHFENARFASAVYVIMTTSARVASLGSRLNDETVAAVTVTVAGMTKAIFLPVLVLGSISRFGGAAAVLAGEFIAAPISVIYVGTTLVALLYELHQRRSGRGEQGLRRRAAPVHPSAGFRRSVEEKKGSILKNLPKPVRIYYNANCIICSDPIGIDENEAKLILKAERIQVTNSKNSMGNTVEGKQKEAESSAKTVEQKPVKQLVHALPCGHIFHAVCITQWLAVKSRCPLCLRDVNPGISTFLL